ncbi:hypothetical protein HPB47_007678 [Ixodes persulcatus]|uniref:Uncharacterized protein n=1 Tax=Ixodes persulcatus TaxID=34615 RepID=A0AC60P731_IXOPE|nr:hypothetical protein HPB47_007678 [Ixodes persulcatus]
MAPLGRHSEPGPHRRIPAGPGSWGGRWRNPWTYTFGKAPRDLIMFPARSTAHYASHAKLLNLGQCSSRYENRAKTLFVLCDLREFRCVLVLALATCAFAGYIGYGGYSLAAPLTTSYSTVHHAPVVSTLGYGLGYGHSLGYGYGLSGYGLGYGYGLGSLGYGAFYKKLKDIPILRFKHNPSKVSVSRKANIGYVNACNNMLHIFRFRCVLVLALATCAFAGYLGYGGYSLAAPLTTSYSTVHHAPVVSTLGYGLGYGHSLGYGYGLSGYGLGYGYGLGSLGYGAFYKKSSAPSYHLLVPVRPFTILPFKLSSLPHLLDLTFHHLLTHYFAPP